MATTQPCLTENGVAFTVRVDSVNHDCVISADALSKLSQLGNGELDLMDTFHAFEANINGVARRLVSAGVAGTPLQITPHYFRRQPSA